MPHCDHPVSVSVVFTCHPPNVAPRCARSQATLRAAQRADLRPDASTGAVSCPLVGWQENHPACRASAVNHSTLRAGVGREPYPPGMVGIREWGKANGGPPAVVVVGIGLVFAFWPLGVAFLALGLEMWIYRWERFPISVSRKRREHEATERRELLGLAQAAKTELETCRYRLSEAKRERRGWVIERNLPAETYNARWTSSLATADQVAINDALRGFYVWADEMNHRMSRRSWAEVDAIGGELRGKGLDLDDEDVAELDEGLSRIGSAQEHLEKLIAGLRR